MIADIEIEISRKDYSRLLCNMEPHERFSLGDGRQTLVIYPDRNMDAPKIILVVRK